MKVGGGRGRGGMRPFTWEEGGVVVCGLSHGLLFLPIFLSSSSLFLHICSILGFHNQA